MNEGVQPNGNKSSSLGLLDSLPLWVGRPAPHPPLVQTLPRCQGLPPTWSNPTCPTWSPFSLYGPHWPWGPPSAPQAPCLLASPWSFHQLSDSELLPPLIMSSLTWTWLAPSILVSAPVPLHQKVMSHPVPWSLILPACYSPVCPWPVFCVFTAASSVPRIIPCT